MTTGSNELRERLLGRAAIAQRASDEGWYEPATGEVMACDASLLREAAAALARQEEGREAVAWRSRMPGDTRWLLTYHEPTVQGIEKQALYTHPAPPSAGEGE